FAIHFRRIYGARRGIERHVEEHGAAADGKGAAPGCRPFPFGSTRLVEMQMNIDAAGENEKTASVNLAGAAGADVRSELGNPLVLDSHVGSQPAVGADHRAAAKNHATHVAPARPHRGT